MIQHSTDVHVAEIKVMGRWLHDRKFHDPPIQKFVGNCQSVSIFALFYLYIYLYIYLSLLPNIWLSVCLSVCLSVYLSKYINLYIIIFIIIIIIIVIIMMMMMKMILIRHSLLIYARRKAALLDLYTFRPKKISILFSVLFSVWVKVSCPINSFHYVDQLSVPCKILPKNVYFLRMYRMSSALICSQLHDVGILILCLT